MAGTKGPVRGQFSVFMVLGLLTALSAGGAVWSAVTGPNDADVQLQDAAANTVAASSMVVDASLKMFLSLGAGSSGAGGSPVAENLTINETVDYQAPDRIFATASEVGSLAQGVDQPTELRETQIGSSCWEYGSPITGGGCSAGAIAQFFSIVRSLEHASGVTFEDGSYHLSPSASETLFNDIGGSGGSASSGPTGSYSAEVQLQGGVILSEYITEGGPAGTGTKIDVRISEVGSAPPVVRPSGPPTATG
jgi:hypothetical protein